ncbi:MAG: glycosyltransferase family 2 protein [Rubrobacteraceae bacterium]
MRFSLILGTVERTDDLKLSLGSLDAQTHKDFELIVVDQNPDERLAPILAPYTDRFPLIHFRTTKRGLSRAKNLGLKRASREVIGFPDDNCQYPPDLLERVDGFFASHPEVSGLCGRSVDETGRDSNLLFDKEAGFVDRFNVWRRAMAYNIFLRRESVLGVFFDEELGPGAGTKWWAADETDFLLRVMERGASVHYDPGCVAIHPQPFSSYDRDARRRAYHYGCGMGRVLDKHGYPPTFKARMLAHPLKDTMISLARRDLPEARYLWSTFTGRVDGLISWPPGSTRRARNPAA